jgi:hypothetical protein
VRERGGRAVGKDIRRRRGASRRGSTRTSSRAARAGTARRARRASRSAGPSRSLRGRSVPRRCFTDSGAHRIRRLRARVSQPAGSGGAGHTPRVVKPTDERHLSPRGGLRVCLGSSSSCIAACGRNVDARPFRQAWAEPMVAPGQNLMTRVEALSRKGPLLRLSTVPCRRAATRSLWTYLPQSQSDETGMADSPQPWCCWPDPLRLPCPRSRDRGYRCLPARPRW